MPLEALFELGEAVEKLLVLDDAGCERCLQVSHDFCRSFAEEGFIGEAGFFGFDVPGEAVSSCFLSAGDFGGSVSTVHHRGFAGRSELTSEIVGATDGSRGPVTT